MTKENRTKILQELGGAARRAQERNAKRSRYRKYLRTWKFAERHPGTGSLEAVEKLCQKNGYEHNVSCDSLTQYTKVSVYGVGDILFSAKGAYVGRDILKSGRKPWSLQDSSHQREDLLF